MRIAWLLVVALPLAVPAAATELAAFHGVPLLQVYQGLLRQGETDTAGPSYGAVPPLGCVLAYVGPDSMLTAVLEGAQPGDEVVLRTFYAYAHMFADRPVAHLPAPQWTAGCADFEVEGRSVRDVVGYTIVGVALPART